MRIAEHRVESPLGRWVQHEWRPEPGDALHGVVERIAHCQGRAAMARERVFPDTTVELVVHIGEPHRRVEGAVPVPLAGVCLSGIHSAPTILEAPDGPACALVIRLRPAGAPRCGVTTLAQDGLPRDPAVLRTVAGASSAASATLAPGVYAQAEGAGLVQRGDGVARGGRPG